MIQRRFPSWLLLLIPLALTTAVQGTEQESLLLGNWTCESGACPDEEIQFAIEGERRVYNSGLQQRPSAVNGTWSLEGNVLVVECCGGVRFEWVLVKVGETELRLRESGEAREIVFSRISV